jgi:hypothetical protein
MFIAIRTNNEDTFINERYRYLIKIVKDRKAINGAYPSRYTNSTTHGINNDDDGRLILVKSIYTTYSERKRCIQKE